MEHYNSQSKFSLNSSIWYENANVHIIVADYSIFILALVVYLINVFRLFVYKEKR